VFVVDYILTIASQPWPIDYILSAMGISDLLTILPWLVEVTEPSEPIVS
jgi:hypothetical protein